MHLTGAAAAGMKHDDNGGVGAETLRDVDEDAKVGGIGTEVAELWPEEVSTKPSDQRKEMTLPAEVHRSEFAWERVDQESSSRP